MRPPPPAPPGTRLRAMIVLCADMRSGENRSTFLLFRKPLFWKSLQNYNPSDYITKLTEGGNGVRLVPVVNKMLQKTDFIFRKDYTKMPKPRPTENMTVKQHKLFHKSKVWIDSGFGGLAHTAVREEGPNGGDLCDRYATQAKRRRANLKSTQGQRVRAAPSTDCREGRWLFASIGPFETNS